MAMAFDEQTPTQSQLRLMSAIVDLTLALGYPPSYCEIADELQLASRSSLKAKIDKLAARGWIKRDIATARCLSLTEVGFKTLDRGEYLSEALQMAGRVDRGELTAAQACYHLSRTHGREHFALFLAYLRSKNERAPSASEAIL
jgi:SOS-response transcriptional repressor LexA